MMTPQSSLEKFSKTGLNAANIAELYAVCKELDLRGIAEKAAAKVLPDSATEEMQAIGINAPLRALNQARQKFLPTGKSPLSGYLKHYTYLWAVRYAENALKGKPVPVISLEESGATNEEPEIEIPPADLLFQVEIILGTMELKFQSTRDQELSFRLCCGGTDMAFFANTTSEAVLLSGYIPLFVPIYRRAAVAEALTRINWKTLVGTFAMDYTDGQLRIRTLVPAAQGCLHPEIFGKALSTLRREAATYSQSILEIALTDHDPETVIARATAGQQ